MIFPTPLSSGLSARHNLTHMVHSFWLRLVFKWHLVELCQVLLDLKLAEEGIASEGELVWGQRLVSTR